MNLARIAELLRLLADEIDVGAEAPRPTTKKTRGARPRSMVRPPGESTPEMKARAAEILRKSGFR